MKLVFTSNFNWQYMLTKSYDNYLLVIGESFSWCSSGLWMDNMIKTSIKLYPLFTNPFVLIYNDLNKALTIYIKEIHMTSNTISFSWCSSNQDNLSDVISIVFSILVTLPLSLTSSTSLLMNTRFASMYLIVCIMKSFLAHFSVHFHQRYDTIFI